MVVSWGAPTLQFIPVTPGGTAPASGAWTSVTGLITIPGDDLLENSSQLQTSEGEERTLRNEKGVEVDSMRRPASYNFTTSVIKAKGYTAKFSAENGVVAQNYAMRLIPEDASCVGFEMRLVSISIQKAWSAEQGALDVLNIKGLRPNFANDTDHEICKDYTGSTPEPEPEG